MKYQAKNYTCVQYYREEREDGIMGKAGILERLENKEIKSEELADEVLRNSDLLPELLKGLSLSKAPIKFCSAKTLRTISEKKPELLYPELKFFIQLLESENNIIKWNAMDILANLVKVDTKRKFDKIFDKYYGGLEDESMVTAAHVVDNSGKIAKAKPYLAGKITTELLRVEKIPRNQECRNILMGKTILAFNMYWDQIDNKDEVNAFVRRQLNNTRHATKNKAEKFLRNREK